MFPLFFVPIFLIQGDWRWKQCFPLKDCPFQSTGVVNEGVQCMASGHEKGPCGHHRVRGSPCRQICSDGTFDGVIERRDETRCTRSQAGEFCWVMFDGVCSCTHLHLSHSFTLTLSIRFWQPKVKQRKREQKLRGRLPDSKMHSGTLRKPKPL